MDRLVTTLKTYLLPVGLLGRSTLVVGALLLGIVAVSVGVAPLTLLATSSAVVVLSRHGDVELNSWWVQAQIKLLPDVWVALRQCLFSGSLNAMQEREGTGGLG